MAKVTLSVPIETLIERKAKLQQALLSDEPLKVRRPTRNGFEWHVMDRHAIQNEILKIDLELERRQTVQEQEDKDVKEGNIIRTHGKSALEFFKLKILEQKLRNSEPLIKAGKEKRVSDKKRSESMKGKNFKACPLIFFEVREIAEDIKKVKSKADIGLILVHGKIDLQLNLYSAESLQNAFNNSFSINIAKRTWQKWKSKEYSKPTRAKRVAYSKKFSEK